SEFLDRADGWRPIYQFELWVGRRPAWPSRRQSRQGTRWRPFRHLDPLKQWRSHDADGDRSRLQRRFGPRRVHSGGRTSGEQSAGASRPRLYARTRHFRVELRFWGREELLRARRCLRGSTPARRWRQGRHTLPVVRGDPSLSPKRKIGDDIREGFVVHQVTTSTFSVLMQLSALGLWTPVPANTS